LNDHLYEVVHEAYLNQFTVQSNYAREHSQEVASAASLGLISTLEAPMVFGRQWRVTGVGLQFIRNGGHL
jgi:hypothetical protein